MNQHSETPTIRFYDDNAAEYTRSTLFVEMESLYEPFLRHIPNGGRILDAGCGSGRDSKAFLDRGYYVVSIDASPKMVDATTKLTGQEAFCLAFQDAAFVDKFDGVWACASLLHVPLAELNDVLCRLASALRSSGIIYASFKEGQGERHHDGRQFTDMDESSITQLVTSIGELEMVQFWRTSDLRTERVDQWVNVILQKRAMSVTAFHDSPLSKAD